MSHRDDTPGYTLDLPPALRLALAPAQLRELERLLHATGLEAAAICGRPIVGVDLHFVRLPTLAATPLSAA